MNSPTFYTWLRMVAGVFPVLGAHQLRGLALLSFGVVVARHCGLRRLAEGVAPGHSENMVRRLQRWLSNPRLPWQQLTRSWVQWVLQTLGTSSLLLVDETRLSNHLSVMMVGVAYRGACIPLVWRSYLSSSYPAEGQVALIQQLLSTVVAQLAQPADWYVLADRGIGTSPDLVRALNALGLGYALRVQRTTRFRTRKGKELALGTLVNAPGQAWRGYGMVFKKAGWLPAAVQVWWEAPSREPCCLVCLDLRFPPQIYRVRFWHEVSFRDLKSDGWQWQTSRVWTPSHSDRLLLAMALAYLWVVCHADLILQFSACRSRYSPFRRGLDFLTYRLRLNLPVLPSFSLSGRLPFLKTVLT
jgi:hypothetical protein